MLDFNDLRNLPGVVVMEMRRDKEAAWRIELARFCSYIFLTITGVILVSYIIQWVSAKLTGEPLLPHPAVEDIPYYLLGAFIFLAVILSIRYQKKRTWLILAIQKRAPAESTLQVLAHFDLRGLHTSDRKDLPVLADYLYWTAMPASYMLKDIPFYWERVPLPNDIPSDVLVYGRDIQADAEQRKD